jgi:hypothetical protein
MLWNPGPALDETERAELPEDKEFTEDPDDRLLELLLELGSPKRSLKPSGWISVHVPSSSSFNADRSSVEGV